MPYIAKPGRFTIAATLTFMFVLFLTTLLISCSSSDKQKPTAKFNGQSELSAQTSRPDTIEAKISIEGMSESMPMYLLESPEIFPLHFTTYIPTDMQTNTVSSDEGTAIRILANFGDILNKDAHLTIFAFPLETTAEEARKKAEETVQSVANISEDAARYPWAEMVYSLQGDRTGFLALAQKKDNWFYLLAAYPPEYGDGMGPRINQIIEQWRWDSGKPLGG